MDRYYVDRTRYHRAINSIRYATQESIVDWFKVDTLIKNWEKLVTKITVEEVICRRKRRVTDEYRRLEKKFVEYQTEIEQAITMFNLIYN